MTKRAPLSFHALELVWYGIRNLIKVLVGASESHFLWGCHYVGLSWFNGGACLFVCVRLFDRNSWGCSREIGAGMRAAVCRDGRSGTAACVLMPTRPRRPSNASLTFYYSHRLRICKCLHVKPIRIIGRSDDDGKFKELRNIFREIRSRSTPASSL